MKKVTVRVPLRADLAGGTLDLWPLYLFHPSARTVNVAISFHAECEISTTADSSIELHLSDSGYEQRYDTLPELSKDPKAALIAKAAEHFALRGVRIVTRTDAPRGSGLGGSSALAIALVRAMSEIAEAPVEGDDLIVLVRDLETRLLGIPAGVQDYYPPVYGGLAALHLLPGKILRHPINLSAGELARHFVLHYSEVSHFSGTNNWEIYKRHIDNDTRVIDGLERIAQISNIMEKALEARDLEAAGKALLDEWNTRKALVEGISTPEIDAAVDVALRAGAWGAKVCGAGGGGCIVFLAPAERREDVIRALARVPGRTLTASPVSYGLTIEGESHEQAVLSFGRRGRNAQSGEPLEQLFLKTSDESGYRPFVLAEAGITYDDPRIGVHHTEGRTLVAPVDYDGRVIDWSAAIPVDLESLSLSAVPDPSRRMPQSIAVEVMVAAGEGVESLRLYLRENERISIWQNPSFGLYSEIGESKSAFIQRCMEAGEREIDSDTERMESTFRRRLDQLKERSERDQREMHGDEESPEFRSLEVGISWNQALRQITGGRPASTEQPASVSEADYLERISQMQKQWDREHEVLREEQRVKAENVEELELTPSLRNIEILKYVVLWAPRLPVKPR
jgi:D-glycero-alpha-D-manno-heptose-7-phosphate kinase